MIEGKLHHRLHPAKWCLEEGFAVNNGIGTMNHDLCEINLKVDSDETKNPWPLPRAISKDGIC